MPPEKFLLHARWPTKGTIEIDFVYTKSARHPAWTHSERAKPPGHHAGLLDFGYWSREVILTNATPFHVQYDGEIHAVVVVSCFVKPWN
jgi:hypothetical protein